MKIFFIERAPKQIDIKELKGRDGNDEIDFPKIIEANRFTPVNYHDEHWLFCTWGTKDWALQWVEHNFLQLKSEITAFSSEIYRRFASGHSPKYRSIRNEGDLRGGFITEEIELPYLLQDLFQEELTPQAKDFFQERLLNNGLPEIMAVASYILSELDFMSRNILLTGTSPAVFKIDHERCLWDFHLQREDKSFDNRGMATVDKIDSFPFGKTVSKYWPRKDSFEYYPEWFIDLLKRKEFKSRAYMSFLLYALVPDEFIIQECNQFFSSEQRKEITRYILLIKKNLYKSLIGSCEFATFLLATTNEQILLQIDEEMDKNEIKTRLIKLRKACLSRFKNIVPETLIASPKVFTKFQLECIERVFLECGIKPAVITPISQWYNAELCRHRTSVLIMKLQAYSYDVDCLNELNHQQLEMMVAQY